MPIKSNLVSLYGIVTLCFGLLFIGWAGQNLYDTYRSMGILLWEQLPSLLFPIGLLYFITGLGLLLHQQWARWSTIIILAISILAWTAFIIYFTNQNPQRGILHFFSSLFVYAYLTFGVFFLNHEQVMHQFGKDVYADPIGDDILDQ